jgi:hypothetical protein
VVSTPSEIERDKIAISSRRFDKETQWILAECEQVSNERQAARAGWPLVTSPDVRRCFVRRGIDHFVPTKSVQSFAGRLRLRQWLSRSAAIVSSLAATCK